MAFIVVSSPVTRVYRSLGYEYRTQLGSNHITSEGGISIELEGVVLDL